MEWSVKLIKYWCEHYYSLRNYELNPFEQIRSFKGVLFVTGSNPELPNYVETCEMNWEFDRALGKLTNIDLFKKIYFDDSIPPNKESKVIYKKFSKLLMEGDK